MVVLLLVAPSRVLSNLFEGGEALKIRILSISQEMITILEREPMPQNVEVIY